MSVERDWLQWMPDWWEVPEPPQGNLILDHIRWAICVIDPDEMSRVKFLAGCLAYGLAHEGELTRAQARVAHDIIQRLRERHKDRGLMCQIRWGQQQSDSDDADLAAMPTEGSA